MKEYSYNDIQKITEEGILFKDGFKLSFEECRNEWLVQNKIKGCESHCVAERDSLSKSPFFLFYTKDRVKVCFNGKGIFGKKKNREEFQNLQAILSRFGFSSYDMT